MALDALCGEPAGWLHPVVWMGRVLDWLEGRAPRENAPRLVYGCAVACAVPLGWGLLARTFEECTPWPLQALALEPTFAGRALLQAGRRVEVALDSNDLARARGELRSLVSRPTQDLDLPLVAAAAIESLSENLVDSWVAPLLAYTIFGLSGAYAYRAVNTADAMWGYRTARYEQLGKASARLDDGLNFLPARVGAVLLCCAAGHRWRAAWSVWQRDAGTTSSPNAGQTMACAAGALGVRLEKQGHYVLNRGGQVAGANDIADGRRLVRRALWLAAALTLFGRLVVHD